MVRGENRADTCRWESVGSIGLLVFVAFLFSGAYHVQTLKIVTRKVISRNGHPNFLCVDFEILDSGLPHVFAVHSTGISYTRIRYMYMSRQGGKRKRKGKKKGPRILPVYTAIR